MLAGDVLVVELDVRRVDRRGRDPHGQVGVPAPRTDLAARPPERLNQDAKRDALLAPGADRAVEEAAAAAIGLGQQLQVFGHLKVADDEVFAVERAVRQIGTDALFGVESIEHDHGGLGDSILAGPGRSVQARTGRPKRRPRPSAAPPGEPEGPRFRVRVIDNAWNTYEQVMRICVVALGCSLQEAYSIAWAVDHEGSAVVLEADRGTAEHVAGIIGTIGIEVRVEPLD